MQGIVGNTPMQKIQAPKNNVFTFYKLLLKTCKDAYNLEIHGEPSSTCKNKMKLMVHADCHNHFKMIGRFRNSEISIECRNLNSNGFKNSKINIESRNLNFQIK